MNRWRTPALVALWLQVVSLLGLALYTLWAGKFGGAAWFSSVDLFLGFMVLSWWTTLLGRVTLGQGTPPTDGTWRSLSFAFPLLAFWRGFQWLLFLLNFLGGAFEEANSVALTALLTVMGADIVTRYQVYRWMLPLSTEPGNLLARTRLLEWLNLSAALSVAGIVMNALPIKGLDSSSTELTRWMYAGAGVIEVAATLLAFMALMPRKGLMVEGQEKRADR